MKNIGALRKLAESSPWEVVYEKAIRDDGTLFFPERLSSSFLDRMKKSVGSYIFANQYQNEVIPEEDRIFKPEWIKYYKQLPEIKNTIAFLDPAISQSDKADYTAVVVVDVDIDSNWYIRFAHRDRITPTQQMELVFKVYDQYRPLVFGIEDVAYQAALLYMIDEESKKRQKMVPVKGIKRGPDRTKEARISALQPRFEWGRIFLSQGLHDFETELMQFPRGSHDDLIDAAASIEEIVVYPQRERKKDVQPNPNDPGYESWWIRERAKQSEYHED